jgi:hypothetical protein
MEQDGEEYLLVQDSKVEPPLANTIGGAEGGNTDPGLAGTSSQTGLGLSCEAISSLGTLVKEEGKGDK